MPLTRHETLVAARRAWHYPPGHGVWYFADRMHGSLREAVLRLLAEPWSVEICCPSVAVAVCRVEHGADADTLYHAVATAYEDLIRATNTETGPQYCDILNHQPRLIARSLLRSIGETPGRVGLY